MRAVVSRVDEAWVSVVAPGDVPRGEPAPGVVVGRIGPGLAVLVGVTHDDDEVRARRLADRVWGLRIFDGVDGGPERSVGDVTGEVLVVSQFTLYGDATRGRRPSWTAAARPEHAAPLVDVVVARLAELGARVATGRFGADMRVGAVGNGPFTILVEV